MGDRISTKEPLNDILMRLNKLEKAVAQKQLLNPEQIFFDNAEFIQIMNISKRTAQSWRDKHIVAYCQVGNKVYYKLSDILNLLETNYKPAKIERHG